MILTKASRTDGPTDGRTDRRTDGPTDGRTDRPSYRDARTHLEIIKLILTIIWSLVYLVRVSFMAPMVGEDCSSVRTNDPFRFSRCAFSKRWSGSGGEEVKGKRRNETNRRCELMYRAHARTRTHTRTGRIDAMESLIINAHQMNR